MCQRMFRIPALHGARQELAVVEPSVTSASPGEDVKMKDGKWKMMEDGRRKMGRPIRRIILDSLARTPLKAKVVSDKYAALTTIVVGKHAPKNRVTALAKHVNIIIAPAMKPLSRVTRHLSLDLRWLLKKLGAENVTSLLVEGGGEVNASFLLGGFAHRVAFFYAPKILGGRDSRKAVASEGAKSLAEALPLQDVEWKQLGPDLLLTAKLESKL